MLMTVDAIGGVWRYAVDVASGLEGYGIHVLLVGFGPEPSGAQNKELQARSNVRLIWSGEPLDWMASDATALHPGVETLDSLAAAYDVDLMHLNLPSQAVGHKCRVPVVVASHSCVPTWWEVVHGTDLPSTWKWQYGRNLEGFLSAQAVIVPSVSHGTLLSQVYDNMPPLHVVHNATSVTAGTGSKEEFVLGAGRWWDLGKNGATLDAAAASSPWPVTLIGQLQGPSGEMAAFNNVQTTGPLSHEEVVFYMRRASIFAAPSRYEPFGLAVAEAAIAGAALVLSDIPTFRELWTDAAVFVRADDVVGWVQALSMLAADESMRQRLVTRATARARAFAITQQATEIFQVYLSVMAKALA